MMFSLHPCVFGLRCFLQLLCLRFAHLPRTVSPPSTSPSWMGGVFLLCLSDRPTCFSLTAARPGFTLSIFISAAPTLASLPLLRPDLSDERRHRLHTAEKSCRLFLSEMLPYLSQYFLFLFIFFLTGQLSLHELNTICHHPVFMLEMQCPCQSPPEL